MEKVPRACLMSLAAEMPASPVDSYANPPEKEELKLYEELLSVTTHDLRSPLGAIGIFCELLLTSDPPIDPAHVKSVEMISEAAAKAQRILEDASEVSRIYRGVVTLTQESLSLSEQFEQAVALVREAAQTREVSIVTEFKPGNYRISADPSRLEQALLRLVEEAAASCASGGKVVVSSRGGSFSEPVVATVKCNGSPRMGERPQPESLSSLKGRLANRKPNESRYSLTVAQRVVQLMGGTLQYGTNGLFQAEVRFPLLGE